MRLVCKRFSKEFTKEALIDSLCVTRKKECFVKGVRILTVTSVIEDFGKVFVKTGGVTGKRVGVRNGFGKRYFVDGVNYDEMVKKYALQKAKLHLPNTFMKAHTLRLFDGGAFLKAKLMYKDVNVIIYHDKSQLSLALWYKPDFKTRYDHWHNIQRKWPKKCPGCPVAKYLSEGYRVDGGGNFFKDDSTQVTEREKLRHIISLLAPIEHKRVERFRIQTITPYCPSNHGMTKELFCKSCNRDYSSAS